MKRTGTLITLLVIIVLFVLGIRYIYLKDKQDPVVYTTEQASTKTIVKKTVATGSIVPKEEVLNRKN